MAGMKITKRQLRGIIKEEILGEVTMDPGTGAGVDFYIKKHHGMYLIMTDVGTTSEVVLGPFRTEKLAQARIDRGDLESELATVRSMPWSMQR